MKLSAFLKNNDEVVPFGPERVADFEKLNKVVDLERLQKAISESRFLKTRCSLLWLVNNYEKIIAGAYKDFNYFTVEKSQHFKRERKYSQNELNSIITPIEEVDF